MKNTNLPKGLPDSKIISELFEKASCRKDSRINFIAKLEDLRERINSEVKYVSQLFPEYTPHDEENHLSRLFFLGDKLLGDSVIANLNCTELFILASSLYGHDWGMAVSENEKALIYDPENKQNPESAALTLIEGENLKFKSFLVENNLSSAKDISLFQWQEYVRNTHAIRSGERIRKYFESIDSGLGEAIARVCEGHWLDFKDIQDSNSYPTNYAISNETVNLRAIAIYVRLIDLFDITQERTPYVIWKYVAPKSVRSEMEWKKHRAVYSLSFPPYQDGRVVQVDGGTNNHEVYASLMDLKSLCDSQLKGCNDILTQINDSRYNLNLFHIDWRIQARTFKPISIQFEFDRIRMFEILSDEIYQGDKYVFLRELLQNSIDAINVRRAILEKRGLKPESIGLIEIIVKNKVDGNCEIIFTDDGVGMDEYIIRNYLSIAGKSYYNSEDFMKLGLSLDPISKFGVGVLSCFMVADEIQIETFMDPYMNNGKSESINIRIPAVEKQFRVNAFINHESKIGTTFKIHVLGNKLKSGIQPVNKLKVTEYLLRIAGFVKVPIKIEEDGLETLIIHPNENTSIYQAIHPTCQVRKLEMTYPWEKVFLPQSLKNAKEILKETKVNIATDLKLGSIAEGVISFVEPFNKDLFIVNYDSTWPGTDFIFKDRSGAVSKRIRFNREWAEYDRNTNTDKIVDGNFGKSARVQDQLKVYLDGILLPNVSPPEKLFSASRYYDFIEDVEDRIEGLEDRFVLPMIILNFRKSALTGIDLSRTEIVEQARDKHWENSIRNELNLYFKNDSLTEIKQLPIDVRLPRIANLILFKRLRVSEIINTLPLEKWPVPIISQQGYFEVKEWGDFFDKELCLEPHFFNHFGKFLLEKYEGVTTEKSPLDNWGGGEFIIANMMVGGLRRNASSQTVLMIKLVNVVIKKTHSFSRFRFLKSPWKNGPPFIQSIWEPTKKVSRENPKDSNANLSEFESAIRNFDSLDFHMFKYFWDKITSTSEQLEFSAASVGVFESPFESKVCYGFRIINFKNLLVKNLLRLIFVVHIEKQKGFINLAILNDLEDKIGDLAFFDYSSEYEGCNLQDLNLLIDSIFSSAAKELQFIEVGAYRMTYESFVNYSLIENSDKLLTSYFRRDLDQVEIDVSEYSRPFERVGPA